MALPSRLISLALHAAVLGGVLAWHLPGRSPDAGAAAIPVTLVIASAGAAPAAAEAPREAANSVAEPSPLPVPRRKPRRAAGRSEAVPLPMASASPSPGEAQATAPRAEVGEPPAAPSADAVVANGIAAASASPPAARAAGTGADYLAEIVAWLARYKRYPEEARRRHDEGTVLIAFAIARDGRVLSSAVRGGSGSALLDTAAEEMIHRADPLPAPPASYPGQRLELVLPVTFSLE